MAAPGGPAGALRSALLAWDGRMDAHSEAAAGYNALRRAMTAILARRSGLDGAMPHGWGRVPPAISPLGQLWWALPTLLRTDDASLLGGATWDDVLAKALAVAAQHNTEPWGDAHRPRFVHPLSPSMPGHAAVLDPPSRPLGGDGDTVMAIGIAPAAGPVATYGALCRYVFDVGNWENCQWAVFLGASGHPGSPHYADQNAAWSRCQMVPMRYGWAGIAAHATATQRLVPG